MIDAVWGGGVAGGGRIEEGGLGVDENDDDGGVGALDG